MGTAPVSSNRMRLAGPCLRRRDWIEDQTLFIGEESIKRESQLLAASSRRPCCKSVFSYTVSQSFVMLGDLPKSLCTRPSQDMIRSCMRLSSWNWQSRFKESYTFSETKLLKGLCELVNHIALGQVCSVLQDLQFLQQRSTQTSMVKW